MFGELVVWYLFLGGVGSGATMAALAVRWQARRTGGAWVPFAAALVRPVLVCALIAVSTGCVCLLGDLRRPELAHLLFVAPTLNIMNLGAIALALFIAALLALLLVDARVFGYVPPRVQRVLEAAAALLALAVAIYTGAYLNSFWTVVPWSSPLLVALFVASSLSCGVAVVYAAVPFALGDARGFGRVLDAVGRADLAVVAVEAVVLLGMAAHVAFMGLRLTSVSVTWGLFAAPEFALPFWLGFVLPAFVLPPLLAVCARRVRLSPVAHCSLAAVAVLVGGFFLRYCMVNLPLLYKAAMLAGV